MQHWTDFSLRPRNPLSARTRVEEAPPRLRPFLEEREALLETPLSGITNDGIVRTGLYPLAAKGADTRAMTDAACRLLQTLSTTQRERACFAIDAPQWRTWINIHVNFYRHGIMLEELDTAQRALALNLMRETLSRRGFQQARDIMRINAFLAELTNSPDEFGEWPFFIAFFGQPESGDVWGWQIDGHHLNLNCMVVGDRIMLSPAFMGSEPCRIDSGPMAGIATFELEQQAGLDMIRSLSVDQTHRALIGSSLLPDDLPESMQHPFDGRMLAGAFQDNAAIPYEGVPADALTDAQRDLLLSLVGAYVGWARDDQAKISMDSVRQHLDETWFAWMGNTADHGPFYYRVQSPVVLIEFDHHPGVVFDNSVPTPHHIHTVVRAPNGGDYGLDLLRHHHDTFDHSHGDHRPR